MTVTDPRAIAETCRWHRALGRVVIHTGQARLVIDRAHPNVWDANCADTVTGATEGAIAGVLAAMDRYLGHGDWRVVHSDPFTPEPFMARLALDGFVEQPATIQMALCGDVPAEPADDLHPVDDEDDWRALAELVARDHDEGRRTDGLKLSRAVTDGIVAGYRAKAPGFRFHLARVGGAAVAYGGMGIGPGRTGIIDDLFTLPSHRGRGIASGIIAAFARRMREEGCATVFLGALVGERARLLYAGLNFRPVMLTRRWVRPMR